MKITISSKNSPMKVEIEGPDESTEKMVKATKSLMKLPKIWVDVEAQMSFEKGDRT